LNYIGEGSFGQIFLCKRVDDPSNKLFAMKVQDKKMIDEHEQLRYISRERAILSKVDAHPFIVRIEESF